MKKDIFKLQFRQLQNEINRRESIERGLCAECWYRGECSCDCKNDVQWSKLRYVATQDLYQMRLQFRGSNNPNDVNYDVKAPHKEDDIILMRGAWEVPDALWFTFDGGRLIKQLTSRFYKKNAYDEYVAEISEPNVYSGTYSEL